MAYLYEGHMGGIYTSDDHYSFDELYCEECGDSDTCLGWFDTEKDFLELLLPHCSINGSGGWSMQYVFPLVVYEFNLPIDIPYEDRNAKDCGFCSLTDDEISNQLASTLNMSDKEFLDWYEELYQSYWGYSSQEQSE